MKRTSLNKIGKVGRINIEARNRIAKICEEKNINRCEIQFEGCKDYMFLAPAHRHKRAWYQGDVELLSDYKQWICACVSCHDKIEHDSNLTEEIFIKLRGNK